MLKSFTLESDKRQRLLKPLLPLCKCNKARKRKKKIENEEK